MVRKVNKARKGGMWQRLLGPLNLLNPLFTVMKIKKSDSVKIMSGKDRGKTGKVLQVLVAREKVVVEGLNLRYKHMRPRKQGEKGQRIMYPAPVHVSNVMLVCPKCSKPTRVGFKVLDDRTELSREKKQRVCKKCKTTI